MSRRSLNEAATEELLAELKRRRRELPSLRRRRQQLVEELEQVDARIEMLESGIRADARAIGRRSRPGGGRQTLADALHEVFAARGAMTVAEAADAVRAAGYQTSAKHFRLMVNQALLRDPRFERVERGRYRLAKETAERERRHRGGGRSRSKPAGRSDQ